MIAATIGGPITIDRTIPFIMSLKNNHIVCCIIKKTFITSNLFAQNKPRERETKHIPDIDKLYQVLVEYTHFVETMAGFNHKS